MKARMLWDAILESQVETGTPYMLYKDSCNFKSNQKNLGTIKSSNLCTEIVEYTAPDEVAVCNLASINLSAMVVSPPPPPPPMGSSVSSTDRVRSGASQEAKATYDFEKLQHIAEVVTRNLNRVIDENYYPIEEARNSNMRHRPIGIGVQGLADTFIKMRLPFESEEAARLNRDIFETIYFGAVKASIQVSKLRGHTHRQ